MTNRKTFCKSGPRFILPFWYRPTRAVPDKGPLNRCVRACVCRTDQFDSASTQRDGRLRFKGRSQHAASQRCGRVFVAQLGGRHQSVELVTVQTQLIVQLT